MFVIFIYELFKFSFSNLNQKHIFRNVPAPLSEQTCPSCLNVVDNYEEHVRTCGLERYECIVCGEAFHCYQARRNHQILCRRNEINSSGKSISILLYQANHITIR